MLHPCSVRATSNVNRIKTAGSKRQSNRSYCLRVLFTAVVAASLSCLQQGGRAQIRVQCWSNAPCNFLHLLDFQAAARTLRSACCYCTVSRTAAAMLAPAAIKAITKVCRALKWQYKPLLSTLCMKQLLPAAAGGCPRHSTMMDDCMHAGDAASTAGTVVILNKLRCLNMGCCMMQPLQHLAA